MVLAIPTIMVDNQLSEAAFLALVLESRFSGGRSITIKGTWAGIYPLSELFKQLLSDTSLSPAKPPRSS